jgi:hypothetical protein
MEHGLVGLNGFSLISFIRLAKKDPDIYRDGFIMAYNFVLLRLH